MHDRPFSALTTTRRKFLTLSAASVAASALPAGSLFAQTPARYLRRNLSSPTFPQQVLDSYSKAITAMLQLPPSDPRNWYRNAFIHTLDCPHSNWWFLPWHRGYIGWFEETCRDLSGDPNFALPFWDWTVLPRLPQQFFQGVLNPATSPLYIASYAAFYSQLSNPMSDLWKSFTPAQMQQMRLRNYPTVNDLWAAVRGNPMFYPQAQARTLTPQQPNFDTRTRNAVSLPTLQNALASKDFLNFGSSKAQYHSQMTGSGILEAQPHNNVHNNVGGFMGDFLSPVDPVFFLHHANIDRLWDVWTRKQVRDHLPTLPTGADLAPWSREPFLFYRDAKGRPVAKDKAGDYATIDGFDYRYEKGSGDTLQLAASVGQNALAGSSFHGSVLSNALTNSSPALGQVAVAAGVLEAASSAAQGLEMYANITLQNPPQARGVYFDVYLNAPKDAKDLTPENPHYVATIEFFGRMQHAMGPVTFTVPLTAALKTLASKGMLTTNEPLHLEVVEVSPQREVPGLTAARAEALSKNALVSVAVGAF